jgi:hypothetical protein
MLPFLGLPWPHRAPAGVGSLSEPILLKMTGAAARSTVIEIAVEIE